MKHEALERWHIGDSHACAGIHVPQCLACSRRSLSTREDEGRTPVRALLAGVDYRRDVKCVFVKKESLLCQGRSYRNRPRTTAGRT